MKNYFQTKCKFHNLKQIFNNFHNGLRFKGITSKKIASLSLVALGFILFNFEISKIKKEILYCDSRDFPFLLKLNFGKDFEYKFIKKKCPKIIYLVSNRESSDDKVQIEADFQKIHSKYKDLESYVMDLKGSFKSIKELESLLKLYGHSLQDFIENVDLEEEKNFQLIKETLFKKPFIFLNKYGDAKNYSVNEFREIARSDSVYNYFERLGILSNKNDLLILNNYDYAFVAYLDGTKIDYSQTNFKLFRRIYFLLNFFNVKFFVATAEHSPFLNMETNNIYLIKRENSLSQIAPICKIENENFEILNLTADLKALKEERDDSKF